MHIYFLSKGGVYVAITEKKRKLITRTLSALIITAVILPSYFLDDGSYLYWDLRFGFLMALIEFATVICNSRFVPLHSDEYAVTTFVLVELLACLFCSDQLSVELIGGCIFVCVVTDVFAYLMGTFCGGTLIKKRPFPKISPNKSYEGLIFGISCGIIGAYVWTLFLRNADTPVPFWRFAIVAPLAVFGDLLESRFKRLYDVKDANDFIIDVPILGSKNHSAVAMDTAATSIASIRSPSPCSLS